MGILSWINGIEKRFTFAWSFFGFVLAIVFGCISIYTEFLRENAPKLEIQIISNEPVLDVREKLPDLEVLYQGQDIAKSGKTLSVIIARIINRGSADLLSAYYDSKAPVNLRIGGGTLVKADISETSSEYLRSVAGLTRVDNSLIFSPVILEKNEWVGIKVLALHDVETAIAVSASGKIAGQHGIAIVLPDGSNDEDGFWSRTFSGGLWVQILRFPAYFFGTFLIMLSIIIPSIAISETLTGRKRRALVKRFKERTKIALVDADGFIFERFVSGGLKSLQRMTNIVADVDRLQVRANNYVEYGKQKKSNRYLSEDEIALIDQIDEIDGNVLPDRFSDIRYMIDSGFIEKVEGKWRAAPDRVKVMTLFIEYVGLVDGD